MREVHARNSFLPILTEALFSVVFVLPLWCPVSSGAMRGLLLLILCFYLFGGLGFKSTFCSVRVVEEIGAGRLLLEAVVVVF